jgi:coenzyme Q-binding protein COQ10
LETFDRAIKVRQSADEMLELVSNVSRYPEFIPWIKSMRVTNEQTPATGWTADAEALVAYKGLTERFATRVERNDATRQIAVSLLSGPFKSLKNAWVFTDNGQGCDVGFSISYEFRNPVLRMLMNSQREKVIQTMINAFVGEAKRRYPAQ